MTKESTIWFMLFKVMTIVKKEENLVHLAVSYKSIDHLAIFLIHQEETWIYLRVLTK